MVGGFAYFFYQNVINIGEVSVDKIVKSTNNTYFFNISENGQFVGTVEMPEE